MNSNNDNFLGDNKEINDVFNITRNSYFFIQVKNDYNDFKEKIKKNNYIIDKNLISTLIEEVIDIKSKIRNETISQEINILPKYYTALENLKEINLEKSSYAQNIKYIFEKYDGKKCITLKYIQKEYEIKYNKKISLMTISWVLKNI